ncbi:MAG TPA: sigma-70 family RNA polymerase sigma factor [Actinomycetota bacterium]|nr:sigma-70 family RNA polymerase sigma factor [Actinomycetota bacterium]
MPFLRNRPSSSPAADAGLADAWAKDRSLISALKSGDEAAFRALVAEHGPWMLRLARRRAPSEAVAEEIVQEAWLAVLKGVDRFEGRSSLRTWIFSIVSHISSANLHKEIRSIPFSSFAMETEGPSVPPDRFQPAGAEFPGGWRTPPPEWDENPEQFVATREAHRVIGEAIERLPPAQREVINLRDVEGWTAPEVCNALGITETNQRVLLHRARSRVRLELESYLISEDRR